MAERNRIEYRHDGIVEWYLNTAQGIEQGFTVARAPAGAASSKPLRLELAVRTNLKVSTQPDGSFVFADASGNRHFGFGAFTAKDANGHALPARMEVVAGGDREVRIALVVDDRSAAYPLILDPTILSLEQKVYNSTALVIGADAYLGSGVALSGDGSTLIIGMPGANANYQAGSGVAFLFKYVSGSWQLQAELSGDAIASYAFGSSVALNSNGTVALVGSDNASVTVSGNVQSSAGVTANSTTGLISGSPSVAGSYPVTISVNNATGTGASFTLTINVVNPGSYAYLSNLSARAFVDTGANILFAGFSTSGSGTKNLLLRAVGPGMFNTFGLTGNLTDAQLQLFDNSTALITTNHGWGNAPVAGPSTEPVTVSNTTNSYMYGTLGAFTLAVGSLDSAIVVNVPNGSFTYEVAGTGTTPPTGIGLAEIYDADTGIPSAKLVNISARAEVSTGGNILIAGFTIAGNATEKVLIRGVGPGLNHTFGLGGILATPQLQLFDSTGKVIATNLGWNNAPTIGNSTIVAVVGTASATDMATVGAFTLVQGSTDCAMEVTLPSGGYTAQLTGVGGTTGIGLVEVYELP